MRRVELIERDRSIYNDEKKIIHFFVGNFEPEESQEVF